MGRFCSGRLAFALSTVIMLLGLGACGGSKPKSGSLAPVKITLTPGISASMQEGGILTFIATAQNNTNSNLSPAFAYQSSNTAILTFAPNGVACAGIWQSNYTVCSPQGSGMVQVTASALGATSAPTYVFVHPPVDNITVTAVPQNPQPTPEPCLSMGQTMNLQATAWSQGNDITASVGPFTWTATNSSVVTLTPIVDPSLNLATNQATAKAGTPGLTQVYATASGVSSSAFVQAAPYDSLNYFETCPVQSITLQIGGSNSDITGITSFATNKGTSQAAVAIVFDALGYQLTKAPLTWSSSNPVAISAASSCSAQTCAIATPAQGSGTVTASCTPPTCNIGFPLVPVAFTNGQVPNGADFVPVPVYATTAISGQSNGNGTPTGTSVLATSKDCATKAPQDCTVSLYQVPSTKTVPSSPTTLPLPPNSMMFDPSGAKLYTGGQFGAYIITPANLGGSTSPFTGLSNVTGKVLAVSHNGNSAIFSDTVHSPNEVYVVSSNGASSSSTTLNISGAMAAAFTPDGLKAYILGCDSTYAVACTVASTGAPAGNTLYIYSTTQALQTNHLSAPATMAAFSDTGAFGYYFTAGATPTMTALNVCNNQAATHAGAPQVLSLTALPAFVAPLPPLEKAGQLDQPRFVTLDAAGTVMDIVSATVTVTSPLSSYPNIPAPPNALGSCPQDVLYTKQTPPIQLNQGTLNPIGFFVSPDGSSAYIVSTNLSSILVYNFGTGTFSAIPLAANSATGASVTPLSASMSNDGTLIYVAGNDGTLHQIDTNPGVDFAQISFPSLVNVTNSFCANGASGVDCTLDLIAVKP